MRFLSSVLFFCSFCSFAIEQQPLKHQATLESVMANYSKYCQDEVCQQQLKKMKRYARWQDSKAQLILGTAHFYGDGVQQDMNKAIKWLTRAANNPKADKYAQKAQYMLLSIYENGIGVPADEAKASKLKQQLFENGYSPLLYKQAQHLFASGSMANAIALLEQASNNGLHKASYQLATLYLSDESGLKNIELAGKYLKKLVPHNYKDSRTKLEAVLVDLKNDSSDKMASIQSIQQTLDMEVITVNGSQSDALDPMSLTLAKFKRGSDKYRASTGSRIKGRSCGQTAYSCSGISEEELQETNDEGDTISESEDNQ